MKGTRVPGPLRLPSVARSGPAPVPLVGRQLETPAGYLRTCGLMVAGGRQDHFLALSRPKTVEPIALELDPAVGRPTSICPSATRSTSGRSACKSLAWRARFPATKSGPPTRCRRRAGRGHFQRSRPEFPDAHDQIQSGGGKRTARSLSGTPAAGGDHYAMSRPAERRTPN